MAVEAILGAARRVLMVGALLAAACQAAGPVGPTTPTAGSCVGSVDDACIQKGDATCRQGSLLECRAACDGNNVEACKELGVVYATADRGQAQDLDLAAQLYRKACNMGLENACELLVMSFGDQPSLLPTNEKIALWQRLCASFHRGENTMYGSYCGRLKDLPSQ